MYTITESPFGPYQQFTVENPATGNSFSIVPEVGGTVLDICFGGLSVLDGYKTPEELTEGKWGKCAILYPFPNRMRDGKYTWNGKDYHFPINNAATGNAIHGFIRSKSFRMVSSAAGEAAGSVSIAYDYDGHLDYYPFPCSVEITFMISDNGTFKTAVEVKNLHDTAIPVGFGWHPYFQLTENVADTVLHIPACRKVAIDDRMLPTGITPVFTDFEQPQAIGETFLDNCFLATGDYTLAIEGSGRRLELSAEAALFPYFQVFTPPHRTCVALEPMTCNVDGFNNENGLVELHPNATWKGAFVVKVSPV